MLEFLVIKPLRIKLYLQPFTFISKSSLYYEMFNFNPYIVIFSKSHQFHEFCFLKNLNAITNKQPLHTWQTTLGATNFRFIKSYSQYMA